MTSTFPADRFCPFFALQGGACPQGSRQAEGPDERQAAGSLGWVLHRQAEGGQLAAEAQGPFQFPCPLSLARFLRPRPRAIGLTSMFGLQADDKKEGKGGKKAKTDSKAKPKKK